MYSNPTHTYVLWDFKKKMGSVKVKIDAIFTYFSYEYLKMLIGINFVIVSFLLFFIKGD